MFKSESDQVSGIDLDVVGWVLFMGDRVCVRRRYGLDCDLDWVRFWLVIKDLYTGWVWFRIRA